MKRSIKSPDFIIWINGQRNIVNTLRFEEPNVCIKNTLQLVSSRFYKNIRYRTMGRCFTQIFTYSNLP
ncbi:hypothetical protein FPV208 [Fowlpox virus]|uniref:Uncharacterized protein n=2 Tax=Fowlpox virus TaxID=10261 RepID=Q9J527_FOWPN|nr:hypothetical protein FPV208 [Fowlpox virus]UNS14441.1 ALPV-277 [Albatrosspox virus]CAE52746.1 hypothetical protein [Fowlpox virus isolate HP-438/Munich]AAF44552.1 ORF FPV208 hypothetical protein [Fowlpox virus]ART91641.1 hypothetical protein [Fowlpox virus]AXY04650.1 hypothetical protein [Fowlpox virus]